MKAIIYKQDGKKSGDIDLPETIFNLPWNEPLIHQVVVSMASNERAGTAKAKTRAEVSGSGRKPYRQKGTGRARVGSSRSPIRIGGGVIHGPIAQKNYDKDINKKMKSKALLVSLSQKAKDNQIAFVDSLSFEKPNTKKANTLIESIRKEQNIEKGKIVIALAKKDENVKKSFMNIPKTELTLIDNLNPKTTLGAKTILFTEPKVALEKLETKI